MPGALDRTHAHNRESTRTRGAWRALAAGAQTTLTATDRERLLALGADLARAWHNPDATPATRKRIIRTLIEEIVVRVEADALSLVIRWAGGDHTPLRVRKNRAGQHRWGTDADVVELVTVLARQMPDQAIAAVLNRAGKGLAEATAGRVRACASCATIAAFRPTGRASGRNGAS